MGQTSRKYGDLIQLNESVCVIFTDNEHHSFSVGCLAIKLGTRVATVIVEKSKNLELFKALSINITPTFLLYSNSQLVERIEGNISTNELIGLIKNKLRNATSNEN
jgi:thioredoxin-related protein